MRSAGPAFYMPKYKCWGMARYSEVRPALLDWKTYCSGMGVGYTHFGKEKPRRPPSLLLETDPPLHARTRRIVDRVVFPPALQRLREPFAKEAAVAVERVLARGRFDGMKDLAEAFPLKVFPDAVGLNVDGVMMLADAPKAAAPVPSYDLQPSSEPVKRKRGRPKGSKNKPKPSIDVDRTIGI